MIPKNAITMTGTIDRCWLFAYRAPLDKIQAALPDPLQPITRGDFGFLNVVVSHLRHMRPRGLPAFVGVSYWHVAYRIYARARATEGLYFLRSDADSALMVVAGNALTDFRFHQADIHADASHISVRANGANAKFALGTALPNLVQGSPFENINEAADFLKYKPAGLVVDHGRPEVLRIDRDENAWRFQLRQVAQADVEYLRPFDPVLEICYEVEPIHYIWNRARSIPK